MPFAVTRKGIPLREYTLRRKIDVGLAYPGENGMVPEYELREACVYCNYTWTDWLTLTTDERAMCVAQYRTHLLIEAHVNDAQNQHSESERRKSQLQNRSNGRVR